MSITQVLQLYDTILIIIEINVATPEREFIRGYNEIESRDHASDVMGRGAEPRWCNDLLSAFGYTIQE